MMTSLRNSPSSRQARSSFVTVMRPLQGDAGYWINLETTGRGQNANTEVTGKDVGQLPSERRVMCCVGFYLVERCCRPGAFGPDVLLLWLLLT